MILRPPFIPSVLPETQTYLNNIIGTGGTISQETLQAIDRFVRDCYNAGVWTKLIEVYPIAGNDLNAALVKLKYAGTPTMTAVNFIGSDYAERGAFSGITGNGTTKYINTNFAATSIPNTAHMSAYVREDITTASYIIGANNAAVTEIAGITSTTGANRAACLGAVSTAGDGTTFLKGFAYVDRSSASAIEFFRENVSIGTNPANIIAPNYPAINVFLWARNNNGAPTSWSNRSASFFSIGNTLTATERAAFYRAVLNLQTNLQRNV